MTAARKSFTSMQLFDLATKVRSKLQGAADEPEHNLRRLVGHANLLDDVMDDLNAKLSPASSRVNSRRDVDVAQEDDIDMLDSEDESEDGSDDEYDFSDLHDTHLESTTREISTKTPSLRSASPPLPASQVTMESASRLSKTTRFIGILPTIEEESDFDDDDLESDPTEVEVPSSSSINGVGMKREESTLFFSISTTRSNLTKPVALNAFQSSEGSVTTLGEWGHLPDMQALNARNMGFGFAHQNTLPVMIRVG